MFDLLKHKKSEQEITIQLQMRRNQSSTYTEPLSAQDPAVADYLAKHAQNSTVDIAVTDALIEKYPDSVGAHYRWLVPESVSDELFWLRYFWRCDPERALQEWTTKNQAKRDENPFEAAIKNIQKSLQDDKNPLGNSIRSIQKFFDEQDKKQDKSLQKEITPAAALDTEQLDATFDMTVDTSVDNTPDADETSLGSRGASSDSAWEPVIKVCTIEEEVESPSEVTFDTQPVERAVVVPSAAATTAAAAAAAATASRFGSLVGATLLLIAFFVAAIAIAVPTAPHAFMNGICAPVLPMTSLTASSDSTFAAPFWAPAAYKQDIFDVVCSSSTAPAQVQWTQKKTGVFSLVVRQGGKTVLSAKNLSAVDIGTDHVVLHKKKGPEKVAVSW